MTTSEGTTITTSNESLTAVNLRRKQVKDAVKRCQQRYIETKKYHCEPCNRTFRDQYNMNIHMRSKAHVPFVYKSHTCSACNYTTKYKSSLTKHKLSRKHIRKVEALARALDPTEAQ